MRTPGSASMDTRSSFTSQYVLAAALFVRRARAIEEEDLSNVTFQDTCEHRGLVTAAIMQCAAALETESNEICVYGPGAHLGSKGTDEQARLFLSQLAGVVDHQDTLSRFELLLYLLRKQPLDRGREPFQSTTLLVRLRNELVHYKSRWGAELSSTKLFSALEGLRHSPPPFVKLKVNFFPSRCLSADCGAWAVSTTVLFLDTVYASLGVKSRFDSVRERLRTEQ